MAEPKEDIILPTSGTQSPITFNDDEIVSEPFILNLSPYTILI